MCPVSESSNFDHNFFETWAQCLILKCLEFDNGLSLHAIICYCLLLVKNDNIYDVIGL